jgi:hypothetical protein
MILAIHSRYFPLRTSPICLSGGSWLFCLRYELYFTFVWPCIVSDFLIMKPTRCTNFSNLFRNETVHVSDNSSALHQELFIVHSAMVYVTQVCRHLSSRIRIFPSWSCCSKAVYKPVWHIPLLSVQWITPDEGQRNCPKHVEFHFEK